MHKVNHIKTRKTHNTNVRGSPQPWGYVHQTVVSFIIHQIPDLQNATSLFPYILLIGSLFESTPTGKLAILAIKFQKNYYNLHPFYCHTSYNAFQSAKTTL